MNEKISGYTLDKQQQDIVLDDSNHLLVVAGAGSGKTAVLSERVLRKILLIFRKTTALFRSLKKPIICVP